MYNNKGNIGFLKYCIFTKTKLQKKVIFMLLLSLVRLGILVEELKKESRVRAPLHGLEEYLFLSK